ncbi:serine--tRNA ligase [Paenibacillaceae bacterium]|nr:serine--tRNA ligase [Paenibacillaceae bacterium]
MLDVKWIRNHAEEVQRAADHKGIAVSIAELLLLDNETRQLRQETEQLRFTRNSLAKQASDYARSGEADKLANVKQQGAHNNSLLGSLEGELKAQQKRFDELMLLVPNIVSPDTPLGRSDEDNVEVRQVGILPAHDFEPLDHVELGKLHDIIDLPRGVKAAGSRNYYLKGAGVLLHRAVQQLAIDLIARKGFTLLEVPVTARYETMLGTCFFPLGADQAFRLENEDKWLTGTSEASLVMYHANEIIDVTAPLRLAAASNCFRSEVGSAGRDVHGLYRVHQFAKVEQVVLCQADPDLSEAMLQEITANAETLLRLLELPYRVMAVCTGDMSQKTYKQYDIETWMPSRKQYGETHSASNLHDFQAKRANIRYRDEEGKLKHCHTLNNTMVASPRILIPLLENHQTADGSIRIPEAVRPYMNGIELLRP